MRHVYTAFKLSALLLIASLAIMGSVTAQESQGIDMSVTVNGEEISQGDEIMANESVVIHVIVESERKLKYVQASVDDRSSHTGLDTTSANITYRYRMIPPGENTLIVKAVDIDDGEEEIRATVFRPADSTAELMWHMERLQQELDALEETQSNLSDRRDTLASENEMLRQENEELRQRLEEENRLLPLPGFTAIMTLTALLTTAFIASRARRQRD